MLVIDNINLSIGGTPILRGVGIKVSDGESVGLIGPNGSGKTSLFNCISGFAVPQSGSVMFRGVNVTDWSPARRAAHGLGRIFQNFGVFREMSLIDNLLTALEGRDKRTASLWPWSTTTRLHREEALNLLAEIDLADRAGLLAGSLSGGQMRLLEIVRVRAFGAQLFLLDEPTAGVAPKMKDKVLEIITSLTASGKTVMTIEHDLNFIQNFCRRIVVLDVGSIVLDDRPESIRNDARLHEIYFGS